MSADLDQDDESTTTDSQDQTDTTSNRRQFLGGIGAAGLASAFGLGSPKIAAAASDDDSSGSMMDDNSRMDNAYETRMELVHRLQERGIPAMDDRESLDEETEIPTKISMFTKGLPHTDDGTCDLDAYEHLVEAIETGDPELFESLPMGGHRELIEP